MDDRELEAALDDLLSQPPEEFVSARNALVRTLKSTGRKEDAANVARWRRPTRTTWALNRLAQTRQDDVAALLDAADQVRREQSTGGAGLREAMASLRSATRQAADAALAAIAPARSGDHADVSAALLAVLSDTGALAELARGRLLEIPESGLGAFVSGPTGTAEVGRSRTESVPKRPEPVDRGALRDARRALYAARAHKAAVDAAVAEAGRASHEVQERLDHLRAELEDAESAMTAAAEAMRHAEAAAAAAAADVARAEEVLARLEQPAD